MNHMWICIYWAFFPLNAFIKDTESDSDLKWIFIAKNYFLQNKVKKKKTQTQQHIFVHLREILGSSVGRSATGKAASSIF